MGGAAAGAVAGAAIGSVVPVLGTAAGSIIGGILGGLGGDEIGGWFGRWLADDKDSDQPDRSVGQSITTTPPDQIAVAVNVADRTVGQPKQVEAPSVSRYNPRDFACSSGTGFAC